MMGTLNHLLAGSGFVEFSIDKVYHKCLTLQDLNGSMGL